MHQVLRTRNVLLQMGASNEDAEPPRDRRLPQPLRLELNPGNRQCWGSNPHVVARRRPGPQLQVSTHKITISQISRKMASIRPDTNCA
jgi:hypothetical protein